MLALGAEREEVSVVTDQVGCPTWTGHLAGALVELAERPGETGIHHIAGAGSCSWNELAIEVFDRAAIDCRVLPTTTASFPRPAPRPAYSVLGSERREPLVLAPWQDGVAAYLASRVTA
jgi:dTDP-4-dehydrorhamnose reductase